ncbi:MAG TPA: (Fe-S)-binding protein [Dehalococcoidia bacterium]
MVDQGNKGGKVREIVNLLPKENCGKCGFQNCGGFALAVAEKVTSPFGCHRNPSAGYEICKALGVEVPEEGKVAAGYSQSHRRGRRHGVGHRLGHHVPGFGHDKGARGHRHSGSHQHRLHSHSMLGWLG